MTARDDSWSASWCKGKLKDIEEVISIEVVGSNFLSVMHSETGKLHIATMSKTRIDADELDSLINGAPVDFVLNVSKEPYMTRDALQKSDDEGFSIGGLGDAMRALRDGNMAFYVNPEIGFILQGLKQHTRVSSVTRLDNRRFSINRHGLPTVCVLALNEYELTAESVRNAIDAFPKFDAILKSNPNGVISPKSISAALSGGIKIYKWGELLGALNKEW